MNPPDLKPCPFCGGEAEMLDLGPVRCTQCGARGKEYDMLRLEDYEPMAAHHWNTRVQKEDAESTP